MTDIEKTAVTESDAPCWKCGASLLHLDPPMQGDWRYYCPDCAMLTTTQEELAAAMERRTEGALGLVAAVPMRLVFTDADGCPVTFTRVERPRNDAPPA